jgi:hypothetical protein
MDASRRRVSLLLLRLAETLALCTLPLFAASCSDANGESFGCDCPAVADPVCGSDGITYENGCSAECAGAKIAQVGACTEDGGACTCSTVSDPVCGGNGVTYENACEATCAQQTIAYAGFCGTPPDAATPEPDGGTLPGSCTSQSCGSSQVCVDDGCTVSTCTEAGDGGTCPLGWSYDPNGGCGPVVPFGSAGVCSRACPATTHQCVDVPLVACDPPTCSCLPDDICAIAGGECQDVVDGIVECVAEGPAGL